jgi:hypothetical protein
MSNDNADSKAIIRIDFIVVQVQRLRCAARGEAWMRSPAEQRQRIGEAETGVRQRGENHRPTIALAANGSHE